MSKVRSKLNLPMVDLKGQYLQIKSEVMSGLEQVLENTQFINGQAVKDFSASLSTYLNVKHVIPCANGTDALQIGLMALGLKEGDEVITTPFTFVSTAEVIALLKLKPIFVDIDPDTFLMDLNAVEQKITPRTKCIIPVHLFGQGVDMERLMDLANNHNIYVLEDNAQAIGAENQFSDGHKTKFGTIGHIGCTSFFPSKNLGGYGDGGAIFTNDDHYADQLRMIVNHGSSKRYYHDIIGVNSRLDSMQAVVLNAKLKRLDVYNEARNQVANFYDSVIDGIDGVQAPVRAPWSSHVFHQYTMKVKGGKREELQAYLMDQGISSAIYYPVPLHIQKGYRDYGYAEGNFPLCEQVSKEVLSLPMHTEMDSEKLEYIGHYLNQFFK